MRAFLSLFPDPDVAMEIDRWSGQCWPGIRRRVPVQNLHVTVAFLGDIDHNTELSLIENLACVNSSASVQMTFDKVGYWPQPTILWLGSATVPVAIQLLADRCRTVANRVGIRVSAKRFEPHITLSRNPGTPPQAPLIEPSFAACFDSLHLCESFLDKGGARYAVRRSWALSATGNGDQ